MHGTMNVTFTMFVKEYFFQLFMNYSMTLSVFLATQVYFHKVNR